jgi:glycosyltransferase involved in cell wall biosynthesis
VLCGGRRPSCDQPAERAATRVNVVTSRLPSALEKWRPRRRHRPAPTGAVAYVGFLLGHGGDALQMLALAHGVQEAGRRVRIILPAVESSVTFKNRCDALGIECVRSPLISATMQGSRQNLASVIRLLRSIDEPTVHFHSGNSCLPRSVLLGLAFLGYRRAFVTLQSPYETIEPHSARARFWAILARRKMAAVVSPSAHGARFQIRCGVPPALVTTIRNSIDVDGFGHGDPDAARAALQVGPDEQVVLFCSRIDPQKRPAEAVEIFAAVAAEFRRATLVFVGQGDGEDQVRAEAARLGVADRVRLMGYQTNIPSWLAAATVWLLPTERENFSVAVLEALAAGCAVLSTSCEGNDEVLVDGENAITFAVGDVATAIGGLRALLNDPALRHRLGQAGRATAQNYTVKNMVSSYLALYDHGGPPDSAPEA